MLHHVLAQERYPRPGTTGIRLDVCGRPDPQPTNDVAEKARQGGFPSRVPQRAKRRRPAGGPKYKRLHVSGRTHMRSSRLATLLSQSRAR